jgi:hypothetical protein
MLSPYLHRRTESESLNGPQSRTEGARATISGTLGNGGFGNTRTHKTTYLGGVNKLCVHSTLQSAQLISSLSVHDHAVVQDERLPLSGLGLEFRRGRNPEYCASLNRSSKLFQRHWLQPVVDVHGRSRRGNRGRRPSRHRNGCRDRLSGPRVSDCRPFRLSLLAGHARIERLSHPFTEADSL